MSGGFAEELGLPPVDQVGYVVRDLDRALETFRPIFGDFGILQSELTGTRYRGRPSDVTLRIGFGRSGPLEIELIQVVSGDSPHREVLERQGEGVHHIRFSVDDIEPPLARFRELGFQEIWSHALPQFSARWTYLEAPPGRGGALIELLGRR